MASFQEIINQDNPVLVDFHATWCGPCQTLAPILIQVKTEMGDSLNIIKIDVDKNQAVAAKFHVRGVPTLILFKNGKEIWKQSGVMSKNDIITRIKPHI